MVKKPSKLERILKAGFEIGKYPAYAIVLGSALGCIDIPKPITASKDGRYVAFSVTDEGKIDLDFNAKSRIAVIDTNINQLYFMKGEFKSPIWLSTNGEKVAFSAEGDENEKFCNVYIASRESHQVIKNASYPVLSSDGEYLAFTRVYREKVKIPINPLKDIPPILIPKYQGPAPPPRAPAKGPEHAPAPPAPVPILPQAPKPDPSANYNSSGNLESYFVSANSDDSSPPVPMAPRADPSDNLKTPVRAPTKAPEQAPKAPSPYDFNQPPSTPLPKRINKKVPEEQIKEITRTRLFVRNLSSGLETRIDDDGLVSDFSPNGSHLIYLKDKPFDENKVIEGNKPQEYPLELYVCDIDGRNKHWISDVSFGDADPDSLPLYPSWINENEILFQTRTKRTGKDTEVFIYNVKTRTTQQVTDNEVEELIPQFKDNRIYYETQKIVDDSDPENPKFDFSLYVSKRNSNGTWSSRKLGLKPQFFAIAGDNIYYIKDESVTPPIEFGEQPFPNSTPDSKIYTTTLDELHKAHPNAVELTPTLRKR